MSKQQPALTTTATYPRANPFSQTGKHEGLASLMDIFYLFSYASSEEKLNSSVTKLGHVLQGWFLFFLKLNQLYQVTTGIMKGTGNKSDPSLSEFTDRVDCGWQSCYR